MIILENVAARKHQVFEQPLQLPKAEKLLCYKAVSKLVENPKLYNPVIENADIKEKKAVRLLKSLRGAKRFL